LSAGTARLDARNHFSEMEGAMPVSVRFV
jgi:hypothetical protein